MLEGYCTQEIILSVLSPIPTPTPPISSLLRAKLLSNSSALWNFQSRMLADEAKLDFANQNEGGGGRNIYIYIGDYSLLHLQRPLCCANHLAGIFIGLLISIPGGIRTQTACYPINSQWAFLPSSYL